MHRKRRWLAALLLLALVLSLPLLVNLEVFRRQALQALARQLGREVEITSLTARLLPRPGLVGQHVQVFEQEGFGAEPFLYADAVDCNLPLRLLWTWRWDCSEIHFLRPSINLVRSSSQAWNVGTFLLRGAATSGKKTLGDEPAPVISAVDGRINFKLGADKQVYALTAVRLRVEPLDGGRWRLELQGTPVRGDRRLTETGTLRVRGEVSPAAEFFALPFRFQVDLDQGSVAQLMALVTGREPSWRALASFAATLEGSPAGWKVRGTVTLAQLRHRELVASPRSPRWLGEFNLAIVDRGRAVEINKVVLRGQQAELEVIGRMEDLFGQPRWAIEVSAGHLQLDELMAQWAGLKANVPPEARLVGVTRLALSGQGQLRDWKGELTAPEGVTLQAPGLSRPVELADLRLRLEQGRLELEPLTVQFSAEQRLLVEGDWRFLTDGLPYRLHWRSPGVDLEQLQKAAAAFGWDLFGPTHWQGRAQIELDWRGEAANGTRPRWQGRVELRETKFHPPEFNQPLDILQARLVWSRNRIRIKPLVLRLGDNPVTGTLERRRNSSRWYAKLAAGELRLDALDELLNPGRRGLLARLVGAAPPQTPRWANLAAAGEVRVEELTAGPFRLRRLQAEGRWEQGRLELRRLRFRAYEGRFVGRMEGDFLSTPPQYRLTGNLKQIELAGLLADSTELGGFFTGMAGADLSLQTAGTRPRELLGELQGHVVGVVHDGTVVHLNLLAAMAAAAEEEPDGARTQEATALQSLAGEFRVADQQVELDEVRLIVDGAALELSGRVRFDGGLNLRLRGEPLRVAGRSTPPAATRVLAPSYRLRGSLRRPQVQRVEPAPPADDALP